MNPSFQLIDTGWDKVIHEAATADRTELCVVCPFIKLRTAKRLLAGKCPDMIQVITRFHLGDMCDGVSDTEALRLLLENGAKIRGVRNLHAKLYLFGDQRAIVTSANLTEAGLLRNHEFGFVSSEGGIITHCRGYFDMLWKKAGPDLDLARLEGWERRIAGVRVAGSRPSTASGLPDEGTDAGVMQPEIVVTPRVVEAPQSFVKFFGEGHNRYSVDVGVFETVEDSGCHWACTYPKAKRPRQVKDGAVMFMARLVQNPNDMVVFGRAVGLQHVDGRDEASAADIEARPWKQDWPNYVRVHHAEFVAGTLNNGIRLSELMDKLAADSFASTQDNARAGVGNTDPRGAYRQQAQVQLSNEGFAWLNERLELAFAKHGKLTPAELEKLDWPKVNYAKVALPPADGQKLLRALVGYLDGGTVDVANPKTFPSYKDILEAMGVTPWEEGRLGPQFNNEGGNALFRWLKDNNLPALTGLVVLRHKSIPGGDYFRASGRKLEDYDWWLGEMRKSKDFDWKPYLV